MTEANDPRGFLEAEPTLRAFTSNAEVSRALAAGDGHRLHKALLRLRKMNPRDPAVRESLDRLLAMRRLFLKPAKAPTLYRMNGIGVSIYGKSAFDPQDGTYVTTHCISFLWVPIIPLSQYLVRDAGGGSYEFFGKVPPSSTVTAWRTAGLGAMAAVVLAVFGAVTLASGRGDVHFVNGLDHPVAVEVAGQHLMVPAEASIKRTLKKGPYEVVVKSGDVELQREQIDVQSNFNMDVQAFNVAGVAPLVEEHATYYANKADQQRHADDEPVYTQFVTQTYIQRKSVNFAFKEAPEQIKLSKSTRSATRTAFYLAPGGIRTTLNILSEKDEAQIAPTIQRYLMAAPSSPNGQILFSIYRDRAGEAEAKKLQDALAARWPAAEEVKHLHEGELAGADDELGGADVEEEEAGSD